MELRVETRPTRDYALEQARREHLGCIDADMDRVAGGRILIDSGSVVDLISPTFAENFNAIQNPAGVDWLLSTRLFAEMLHYVLRNARVCSEPRQANETGTNGRKLGEHEYAASPPPWEADEPP